jgi:hypothetical protein
MDINLSDILTNYLYANLKKYRTFEGVKNEMTKENNVNVAIKNYIKYNIADRYKYKSIEFFINYRDLRNQSILRYKNNWEPNTTTSFNKLQTETAFDHSRVKINFNQEKPSSDYTFDYYFNILFDKI